MMRLLFIINPISGSGLGRKVPDKLKELPEYKGIGYDVIFTEYAGHGRILAEEARNSGKYTHIVAVGGDGTVNEVGAALRGTDIIFAIVSLGSGNGFARHLGYSVKMTKALKQVLIERYARIDMLEINEHFSLNVSGVGFDAAVAHEFSRLGTRGIFSYIRAGLKLWFRYPEKTYRIITHGRVKTVKCFILCFANSSQFGNNASIAPHASLRDGLLDICMLKRPGFPEMLAFLWALMNSRIHHFDFYKEIQCEEAIVEGDIEEVHIDGDPYTMKSPMHVKIHKGVLKVVVPKFLKN